MTLDDLQKKWQSQKPAKLLVDTDMLLKEVKRNRKSFESAVFWRDVRETGVAFLLTGIFLYYGIKDALWPMWLLALFCLWVGIFLTADRIVQKRRQPCLSDTLLNCIKSSLAQLNHQIWLVKNVLWWYLLPLGAGLLIFFGYCGISVVRNEDPGIGFIFFILACTFGNILLYAGIYWLNQRAVRKELLPRKKELEQLQHSLENTGN